MQQHPKPWWYRLAERIVPSRCREVPEAANPTWCDHGLPNTIGVCRISVCRAPPRVLLRQVALIKRHVYLQQFACSEDYRFMHSHPFRWMAAIGLWGSYREERIAGPGRKRKAPYLYTMDASVVHNVQDPSPGHTSVFIGVGRFRDYEEGDKRYYGAPINLRGENDPVTITSLWASHIKHAVKRI